MNERQDSANLEVGFPSVSTLEPEQHCLGEDKSYCYYDVSAHKAIDSTSKYQDKPISFFLKEHSKEHIISRFHMCL